MKKMETKLNQRRLIRKDARILFRLTFNKNASAIFIKS